VNLFIINFILGRLTSIKYGYTLHLDLSINGENYENRIFPHQ